MPLLAAILLSFVPALIYASTLYWLDRYEKEPKLLLGAVFFWGAIFAAGGAYVLNTLFGITVFALTGSGATSDIMTGSISAPLMEETLKAVAVLIVFLVFRKEFDTILDGIVYAGVAALGFAATENVLYLYERGYQEDGWSGLWFLFFLRVIFGAWNHVSYTAFIGVGFAVARLNAGCLAKVGGPLLGWIAGMFVHSLHNSLAVFVQGLGGLAFLFLIDWFGWLVILGILLWALSRERAWIKKHLQEEVASGLISQAQYTTAISAWKRGWVILGGIGKGKYGSSRKFYHLVTELAYKKYQNERLGESRGNTGQMIEDLRAQIAQLAPQALTG